MAADEAVVESAEVAEPAVESDVSTEPEAVVVQTETGEEETSFDQLFQLKVDVVAPVEFDEEEDDDSKDKTGVKGKDKKKKKKSVEVSFDPDTDRTVARKKHKRGGSWDWE